jgi:hypothetical protein
MTLAVAQIVRFVSDPQFDIKDVAISSELIASLNAKTGSETFRGIWSRYKSQIPLTLSGPRLK